MRTSGYEGKERIREKLAEARRHLPVGGHVYLVAHMRHGAPSLMKMTQEEFGSYEVLEKGGGGIRIIRATKTAPLTEEPQVAEAARLIEGEIRGKHYRFHTGPALFSRDHVDEGTLLLLEAVQADGGRSILDLGCGYGVIGIVMACTHVESEVTLVDVDIQAVRAATANIQLNGCASNAVAILSNGLQNIPQRKFDLILSHFPLHIPKGEQIRLSTEARDALHPGGKFCLVAHTSYDLRPMLHSIFQHVEVIADTSNQGNVNDGFRVICSTSA